MLNATQERIRCNGLVIIPWWNTIPFQELIEDHFGVDVKRDADHFGVELGIISGPAVQAWKKYPFRAKPPRPVKSIIGGAPGKKSSDLASEAKMALIS